MEFDKVIEDATPLLAAIPNYYIKCCGGVYYCVSEEKGLIINLSHYGHA